MVALVVSHADHCTDKEAYADGRKAESLKDRMEHDALC